MGFGAPWILWSLALIAIPIIIHLFYFRRYKKIYFSSVRFLKEAITEQKKSGKLKNILILTARILTFLFLILAFSLPFFGQNQASESSDSKLVIYIDNTFSMSRIDNNRNLLDEAKDLALTIVEQLDKSQQVMILTNDSKGEQHAFHFPEEAKEIISQIKTSSSSIVLKELNLGLKQVLTDLHTEGVKGIYISDFQENSLPSKWDSLFTQTVLIPLSTQHISNLSIDSVGLIDPIVYGNAPNAFIVKIRNQGQAVKTPLSLNVNGQITSVKDITVPKNAIIYDTLSFLTHGNLWSECQVTVNDAYLDFDNRFYFSTENTSQDEILLIEDVRTPPFIYQVFKSDPHFIVNRQSSISAVIQPKYSMVVLNELNTLPASLQTQIIQYVHQGGKLLIVPSNSMQTASFNTTLEKLGTGVYEEKRQQSAQVTFLNPEETSVSMAFEKIPQNMDLPEVKSFWTITSAYKVPEVSVLKFDNERPFIQKYQIGNGQVYLFASALEPESSDFAGKAIFAPLIFNFSILGVNAKPIYYNIGENQVILGVQMSNAGDDIVKMRLGNFEIIPPVIPMGKNIGVIVPQDLPRAGIYRVQNKAGDILYAACNYNRKESEMKFASPQELNQKFGSKSLKVESSASFLQKNSTSILKSNTTLWKVCLILALIFLIAEILLIRFSTNRTTNEI